MRIILLSFLMIFSVGLYSQNDLVAHYNFDNCLLSDTQGNFTDAVIHDNLDCDCGVGENSDAIYFDGSSDTLFLDNGINAIINEEDFSLGFYFWLNNASNSYSLMSIREGCDRDSSLFIQYLPTTNELILEFSVNIADGVFFRTTLDANRCWNHLMFTRQDDIYALYVNGEFISSTQIFNHIQVGQDYDFTVGYSPCVGITDQFMNGRVDEIRIYDYALVEEEIEMILEYPDQVLTQDTTIFLGDEVLVMAGSSCAQNISWVPSVGVSNPSISEPVIQIEETTLYEINFNHGICHTIDSLLISVVDPDEIDCEQILLPSAFTPNNDGLNDRYGISNRFIVEEIQRFEIYNRWGMMLYRGLSKNDTWDGRYEGEFQPPGTYVYKLEYTCMGESHSVAGSFNILR